ncbi:uncharacterized protein LOC135078316 [Ostrinia nubilalis]|uniref:uncharacterized protein LOC135078316 n=1 Tax=Ostrinia nubilalis TaxID=29057 RepID=UPI00308242B1
MAPTFRGVPVKITERLQLLGLEMSSKLLNFGEYIESIAKTAAKKLCILSRARQYFSKKQRLQLYKAQIRPCMEYCCHLWDGSAKKHLAALDSVERRARRLIDSPTLVEAFYWLHFGECEKELHKLIPPAPFHHRGTRRRLAYHPYIVDIPPARTKRLDDSYNANS